MKLSVESDALVMPSSSGSPWAGLPPLVDHPLVLLLEQVLLDLLVDEEVGVAHVVDPHAAQHLPHDRLDVLVVDLDALEPVDLLDLVDQVLGQRLLAEHLEDVVRVGGAVHERLAGAHAVALAHGEVLALGDQVLLADRPGSGVMMTLRLPLVSLPKVTAPSISAMTACSFGLRASNSSATRGRPPVMSLVLVVSRGILAMMSPASIVSPSCAAMVEPTGRK